MSEEKLSFQAEVSRLLDIVANALYSNKEIFLRELISNASDACDRLRYAAITEPGLTAEDSEFQVTIAADKAARSLTIADNGIGMNREELIENLGTIARSGTAAFMDQLDKAGSDLSLIGQFGVGFYSAFMVAEEVEVTGFQRPGRVHHRSRRGCAGPRHADYPETQEGRRGIPRAQPAQADRQDLLGPHCHPGRAGERGPEGR
jgi:molecular chaperone HtpG